MPCRTFTDPNGREWNVWAVHPHLLGGRGGRHRSLVDEELAEGWLAFEAAGAPAEKRRLAPVPPEWEQFPPPMLIELWERATAVRARLDVHVVP